MQTVPKAGHKGCLTSQTRSIRGCLHSTKMATDRTKRARAAAARQKAARSQKVAKKRNILDRLGASTTTNVVTVRLTFAPPLAVLKIIGFCAN